MVSSLVGEQILRMPRLFPKLTEDDSESDLRGSSPAMALYPSGHAANILLLTTIVRPTYSV
jgi:hypothetical protein